MGFFRDFKDDLSQAVNELLPNEDNNLEETEEQMVNTLDTVDNGVGETSDTEKLKELLDGFTNEDLEIDFNEAGTDTEDAQDLENKEEEKNEESKEGGSMEDNVDLELLNALDGDEEEKTTEDLQDNGTAKAKAASVANDDEVSIISKGTTLSGNISSDGSMDVMGNVTGDIECLGKLTISGKVIGNISASEVFISTDRIEGNVISEGSIKVGLGTVLIGDMTGTSGVIAGAIKGEIDINGPVIIDSTAIIKGNIKAKSIQINNGAIVDGFCSLSYSDVNIDNIFD